MNLNSPIVDAHVLLGCEYHLSLDPEELLRRMDVHGVQMALARPVGAELAVYNSEGNDRVLKSSSRIRGQVTANPWFGKRACDELRRCRDLGAVGLFLHPTRQGFMPCDPFVSPLLELAAEFDWPVMFHTGTYINSDLIAVGEIARRYPNLWFIAGFGGFTDMWFELPVVFGDVPNLLLDASLIWGDGIKQIITECGADRVLFGSAEPRNRYGAALNRLARLGLSDTQLSMVLYENAQRVFRLA